MARQVVSRLRMDGSAVVEGPQEVPGTAGLAVEEVLQVLQA